PWRTTTTIPPARSAWRTLVLSPVAPLGTAKPSTPSRPRDTASAAAVRLDRMGILDSSNRMNERYRMHPAHDGTLPAGDLPYFASKTTNGPDCAGRDFIPATVTHAAIKN